MRFALTDEQQMLQSAVRGSLEREAPLESVRAWCEADEAGPLRELAAQQGWTAIGVPEEDGGQGGGLVELALVVEELARAAAPGPFLVHTGLALPLVRALDPGGALAAEFASGERFGALAIPAGEPPDNSSPAVEADGEALRGEIPFVLAAPDVDTLLVPAGGEVFVVERGGKGVEVEPVSLTDLTRRAGHVRLDGARGARLGDGAAVAELVSRVGVLVAADALGAAQRMLEMTVAYVREREQFGVPVGSFQAVKHGAADMLVDVEAARSAAYYAAWSAGSDQPEAPLHAAVAKSFCCEAAARVADLALALHGAVGFTWEHDLHLFYKRAKADLALFGTPRLHRERVAGALALAPTATPA